MSTSYSNPMGSGQRGSMIAVTASGGLITAFNSIQDSVNGNLTENTWFWSGGGITGATLQFDFRGPVVIDEAKYYQQNSTGQGTWKWQGSSDGSTWTDIGSSFSLGGTATQTITALNGNTAPYRYYRILGISGSTSSSPWVYEWEFQVDTAVTDASTIVLTNSVTNVRVLNSHYKRPSGNVNNWGCVDLVSLILASGSNLVTNGSFETAGGSSDRAASWTSEEDRIAYTAGPITAPGGSGTYQAGGGRSTYYHEHYQDIDVSAYTMSAVQVDMAAYLGGLSNADDIASVSYQFMDAGGTVLNALVFAPCTLSERGTTSSMVSRTATISAASGPQTITPSAAVPGPRAIPPPSISGGNLVVHPLTVGPHRAFPTPIIAGPLTIPTTLGPRAVPAPTLQLSQTITFDSPVLGPRDIPSPRVAHVQVISLAAAVAGPRSVPSPVITGGPKYLSIFTVLGPRTVPVPEIIGGDLSMVVLVGGVDVSQYLSDAAQSCTIASQTIGRWKATAWFEVPTGITGWQPYVGQVLQIIDYGYRIFAGCLTEVICDRRLMTADSIVYKCSASDKSSICDHRVVTGASWDETYDAVQAILDICANYLNGEGISTANLPAVGTFGQLGAQLVGNFNTVTQMFDQVASLTGTVWWIDVDSYLYFSPLDTLGEAPFEITETSGNWRNAQGYEGLVVTSSTTDYYNKLYAVSNLNILPGSGSGGTGGSGAGVSQTFDWYPGSPGIRTAKDSSGADIAVGIVVGNPIASITSLTVNGVAQTTVDFGAYNGEVPHPPDLLWFFTGPATGSPGPGVSPVALPGDHDTIAITYVPSLSTASSNPQYGNALKPIDVHGTPFGTCGSGVYEGVVTVQNISDQSSLNQIAAAELDRIGSIPTTVGYETDWPGLRPGVAQWVTLPRSGIATRTKFLITSVQGVRISPTLPFGGSFRWEVEERSNLDPGNWLKFYERLVARTLNPLPVLQYEEATFVLGTGGALSSGVSITNPYIVGRTGQVVEILAAASVGPVGQDLILTITVGGLPTMQVVIPAGTAANQLIVQEIPKALGLYVFARQVLNISAQYAGTGGATSKAAGVTVKVRWAS